MRIFTIAILFLLCTVTHLSAQSNQLFFEEPKLTRMVIPGGATAEARAVLVNPGPKDLRLRWIRESNSLPSTWTSVLCDAVECQPARIDSADFVLRAGEKTTITPRVYAPQGEQGEGQLSLRVVDVNNRANTAVAAFSFRSPSLSREFSGNSTRLYPNPGFAEFQVSSTEPVERITLTNMLGKVVRTFPGDLEVYQVTDLPNGIYLATLYGQHGNIIKTLRYNKRQAMP